MFGCMLRGDILSNAQAALNDVNFSAQRLLEFVVEVVEGAVEQLHGAVEQVAAPAAGQHGAKVFQGGEVGCGAAPGVDAIQQAAISCQASRSENVGRMAPLRGRPYQRCSSLSHPGCSTIYVDNMTTHNGL